MNVKVAASHESPVPGSLHFLFTTSDLLKDPLNALILTETCPNNVHKPPKSHFLNDPIPSNELFRVNDSDAQLNLGENVPRPL